MVTFLNVKKERLVGEVQADFNNAFPFLKIEIYKKKKDSSKIKEHLKKSMTLYNAGITSEGILRIPDTMTVGDLENIFLEKFGANVQVSRKSGTVWLETTMTDKWTLQQQNEHGRELSIPERKNVDDTEIDYA
jgi:hypothetical protein